MAQLPVQQILDLRSKGSSDNQIVQQLQRQGFSYQQIYDAMSQADLSKLSGAPLPEEMPPAPEPEPAPQSYPQPYPQEYPAYPAASEERISEVAEAIINEKWEDLIVEVKKIADWKEKMENQLQKMADDFQRLKGQFDELHKGVIGKISEYDENIRDVGSELKAVEKVFKDVIPSFTENVSELSRITKNFKKK